MMHAETRVSTRRTTAIRDLRIAIRLVARVGYPHTQNTGAASVAMVLLTIVIGIVFTLPTDACAQSTTRPQRPESVAPELWQKLQTLDAQLEDIDDMRADFIKHKRTPLLKRPLTSKGTVRVKGRMMRWDTQGNRESTTLLRDGELRLYQPQDRRLEIYPLRERFAMLGASPMPLLTELVQQFQTTQQPASELFESPDENQPGDRPRSDHYIALRLVPKDEQMREHVQALSLLIDRDAGRIARLRIEQSAGESTEYRFSDMHTNVGLNDDVFELHLPADVTIVRPLEGASE